MVEPKHVALQNIAEDNEGRLVFYVYVEMLEGVLALEVIRNALEVIHSLLIFEVNAFALSHLLSTKFVLLQGNEQRYINRVDGIAAIVFFEVSASTTTSPTASVITSPTPTDSISKDDLLTVIIVIAVLAVVVLMIIIAVVVGVTIKYVPQ